MIAPSSDWLHEPLRAATERSIAMNKNVTVEVLEEVITITDTLTLFGHVCLAPRGRGMRALRIVYDGPDGDSASSPRPVIRLAGGYGKELAGIEIVVRRPSARNLVLLEISNTINAHVHDIRAVHWGVDCRGVVVAGRESLKLERVNIGCTQPLVVRWGDNLSFADLDLVAPTDATRTASEVLPPIPIVTGMPYAWTFSGQNAIHGGIKMMHVEAVPGARAGNLLLLAGGFRYEQPLPSTEPLIDIVLPGNALEQFILSGGIRSSERGGPHIRFDPAKIWRVDCPPSHFFELRNNPPAPSEGSGNVG